MPKTIIDKDLADKTKLALSNLAKMVSLPIDLRQ